MESFDILGGGHECSPAVGRLSAAPPVATGLGRADRLDPLNTALSAFGPPTLRNTLPGRMDALVGRDPLGSLAALERLLRLAGLVRLSGLLLASVHRTQPTGRASPPVSSDVGRPHRLVCTGMDSRAPADGILHGADGP